MFHGSSNPRNISSLVCVMTGENMTQEGSRNLPLGRLLTSPDCTMSSQHIMLRDTGDQANLTRSNNTFCHTEKSSCHNREYCVHNPGHYEQANSSAGVTYGQRNVTFHVTNTVYSDVTTTHMTGSANQSLACCLTNSCHSPAYTTQPTPCHTNPFHPTNCQTNPVQPTPCQTNPAQPTQCQTNPTQPTQCQTNPAHKSAVTCRTCSENLHSPKFPTTLRSASSSHLLTRPSSRLLTRSSSHLLTRPFRLLTLLTMMVTLSAGGVRGNGLGFLVPDMVESGRCAHPQISDVLDLQRFSGVWYQVEEEPNSYMDIKDCIVIRYTWHGTHIQAVTRGWDLHGDLVDQRANISQVIPVDPTQPRPYLQVRTPYVPPVPYHIIKTDYVHFACVYSCFDFLGMKVEISSILSRTPVATNASLAACYHSFQAMRIDLSRMGRVLQGDECWYDETHLPEGSSSTATPEGGSHRQEALPPLVPTTPSTTKARDELVPSSVAPGEDLVQSITKARDELAPSSVAPGEDLVQQLEDVLTLMIEEIQAVPVEAAAGKASTTDGKTVQVVETTSQDPRASKITPEDAPGQPSGTLHTPRGKFKKRRKGRKRVKGCGRGRHHHGPGCTGRPSTTTTTTTTTTLVDYQPTVRPDVQLVDSQPSYGDKQSTANTEDEEQQDPPQPPSATPPQCTCICDNASSAPATSGLLLLIILLCCSVWGR